MTQSHNTALLPDGLRDSLPPDAGHEAQVLNQLLAAFASHGYERVDPPLVEFEDSLLVGGGQRLGLNAFRLMDPMSQRMMALRADMTPQVARIATTRLMKAPRPLRLAYSGYVLRVRGTQLQPERQFRQAGVEIVGAEASTADAEVMLLAYRAMRAAGACNLTVDINLPTLVPALRQSLDLEPEASDALRLALDSKDSAGVAAHGGAAAETLSELLAAAGPAADALEALDRLALPPAAAAERERLRDVLGQLAAAAPELEVTVDPVEARGFEYQTGLSFTFFAAGIRGELGCGGRYAAGATGEPATGFSLFLYNLLRALEAPDRPRRLLLPLGTGWGEAERWRTQGWVTVAGLEAPAGGDWKAEALRLGCSHYLDDGQPAPAGGRRTSA